MQNPAFYGDAMKKASRRNRTWYQTYILKVLNDAKDRGARDVDTLIARAKKLLEILDSPAAKPIPVPTHDCIPRENDDLMTPIEPEILDILYGSTEKGADERYLKARNKKAPEEKYYFRITTNWDYGWQQKESRQRGRDVNRGRCAILRDTFYRKNNLRPDSPHCPQPGGGEFSVCTEYSCLAS